MRDSPDKTCEQVAVESTAIVPVGSSRCFETRDQGLDIGEQRKKRCTNLKAAVANGCWYARDPMDQTTAEFWFRSAISHYATKLQSWLCKCGEVVKVLWDADQLF